MKYFSLLLIAGFMPACTSSHIDFSGHAAGLKDGVFMVKNGRDDLWSEKIANGSFHAAGELEAPGYYHIAFMDNANTKVRRDPFEVYLEPGKYTIETEAANIDKYPKITSSSKTQQDLSAFYTAYDETVGATETLIAQLNAALNSKKAHTEAAYTNLMARLYEANRRKEKATLEAFQTFMREHPQSAIAAHLMDKLDYESDPAPYYAIYQKMSPAAKSSDEGREIGPKLAALVKLLPGANAPDIQGVTPGGKKFDQAALDKQIYVVDFWRAGNEVSRLNHQDMIGTLLKNIDTRKAGIISISLDDKRDWWTTAIKDDHLTWPQYSDLKGNNSPNVQSWVITTMPTYYLIDGSWHIIARDVSYSRLSFEINYYLRHHLHGNHPVLQYTENIVGGQMPDGNAAGKLAKRG